MLETLRQLMLDFRDLELFPGTPRRLAISMVPRKATVCIGVRRCGMSTYLFQLMQRLLDSGVERDDILYLNFFDDRLHELRHERLGVVLDAWHSLHPESKGTRTVYCFFDEIQAVPGWESFVERLLRTERCQVYLTGSSARMLSKEVATQMRGRALSWELFPFSFREFLDHAGIEADGPFTTRRQHILHEAFLKYRVSGGFPEVVALEPHLRVKTHQEYFNAVLFRDLVERHDVSHPRAVLDLAHWLVDHTASTYTVNSLTGYLKSLGHRVPKTAVGDYLEWLEDAFFLFPVRLFDASPSRSNANPKKIYCVDHSLVTSVASGILLNSGHLLESLVFMALRRVTSRIFYAKTKTGKEVDFVALMPDGSRHLVQVCESLADPRTKTRELSALREAMAETGTGEGVVVVAEGQYERIAVDEGSIRLVPAWRFCLELPDGA